MKLPNQQLKIKDLRFKKKKLLLFSFLIATFCLLLTTAVKAQETQRTVTVINPAISISLPPGGYTEGKTAVINDSTAPITFNLGIQDYIVTDTIGTPNLLPPNTLSSKYSAAAWIVLDPSTFTLNPQERKTVNYYLRVPKNASPCGHYAAIVYSPVGETGTGNGTNVQAKIGSLFYITVAGKCIENAQVSKFYVNPFSEYGPVKVLTQIRNYGNLHISPKASVTVSGLFYNQSQNLDSRNIFPETARDFENSLGQTFMIGRYQATLLGSYGINNNMPLIASVSFWVFPWRLTLIVVLVIVALILAVLYLKKRKREGPKEPKKAQEEPVVTPPPTTK
jgi:hypothetical protein